MGKWNCVLVDRNLLNKSDISSLSDPHLRVACDVIVHASGASTRTARCRFSNHISSDLVYRLLGLRAPPEVRRIPVQRTVKRVVVLKFSCLLILLV